MEYTSASSLVAGSHQRTLNRGDASSDPGSGKNPLDHPVRSGQISGRALFRNYRDGRGREKKKKKKLLSDPRIQRVAGPGGPVDLRELGSLGAGTSHGSMLTRTATNRSRFRHKG